MVTPTLILSPRLYNHKLFITTDVLYVVALIMFVLRMPHDLYHRMAMLFCVAMLVVAAMRRSDLSLWLSCSVSLAAAMYFIL